MLRLSALLLAFVFPAMSHGEACTYDEALMALQNGNLIRAHTLMRMAARDGDRRALHYLANTGLPSPLAKIPEEKAPSRQTGKTLISLR